MEKVLNFQVSLFGSFEKIGAFSNNLQPVMKIVSALAETLSNEKLIPKTVELNHVDYASKKINTETRLQMVSTEQESWTVNFFPERIDINYFYPGGDECYSSIKPIVKKIRILSEKILRVVEPPQGTRLAMSGNFLLKNMNLDEKNSFLQRFSNAPKFYENREIRDWSVRYNSPLNIKIDDKNEQCNYVVEICEGVGLNSASGSLEQRVMLLLDINTISEKTDVRFNYKDLLSYVESVETIMEMALDEIGE